MLVTSKEKNALLQFPAFITIGNFQILFKQTVNILCVIIELDGHHAVNADVVIVSSSHQSSS